uniref:INT2 n=1 Tax=Arundo donax TaxID=35708 RepID=A0A0A9BDB9_ARUDO
MSANWTTAGIPATPSIHLHVPGALVKARLIR